MKFFSEHCLGDGRVFEMFILECCLGILGALPWVFQIGGVASENIVKVFLSIVSI